MTKPAIELIDLGKKYAIPIANGGRRDHWAIRHATFAVRPGERLGLIGRNGAGKSTLLSMLGRITRPTEGEAILRGRAASLLEVGTGFHWELTGRENIFLGGAILGMKRPEILKHFEAIVDFAEVGSFLDMPVKRYSSGMYTRLAFAVAAYLEPEILLVDEVLAVGDAAFQRRCLERMNQASREGITVLFVSHNMQLIQNLCERCVIIDRGSVTMDSRDIPQAISVYLGQAGSTLKGEWRSEFHGDPRFSAKRLAVVSNEDQVVGMPVPADQNLSILVQGQVEAADPSLYVGIAVFDQSGTFLFLSLPSDSPTGEFPSGFSGTLTCRCDLPTGLFNAGRYRVELICGLHYDDDWLLKPGESSVAVEFEVTDALRGERPWRSPRPGAIAPRLKWKKL